MHYAVIIPTKTEEAARKIRAAILRSGFCSLIETRYDKDDEIIGDD